MEAQILERVEGITYQAGFRGATPSTQKVPIPTAEPSPAGDAQTAIAQAALQQPGPGTGPGSTT
eukprot:4011103-Prorocentrum_lima.AAC.1